MEVVQLTVIFEAGDDCVVTKVVMSSPLTKYTVGTRSKLYHSVLPHPEGQS